MSGNDLAPIRAALAEAADALAALRDNTTTQNAIAAAGALIAETFRRHGKLLSCGNGGSMCDAMHLAEELTGRYRDDRPAYPAIAISDASHLSCVGNDYGYERVFARYVEAHGRPGDVLVAISTSGASRNVVAAAQAAKAAGMRARWSSTPATPTRAPVKPAWRTRAKPARRWASCWACPRGKCCRFPPASSWNLCPWIVSWPPCPPRRVRSRPASGSTPRTAS
jgi:phosphoheptose isomerase